MGTEEARDWSVPAGVTVRYTLTDAERAARRQRGEDDATATVSHLVNAFLIAVHADAPARVKVMGCMGCAAYLACAFCALCGVPDLITTVVRWIGYAAAVAASRGPHTGEAFQMGVNDEARRYTEQQLRERDEKVRGWNQLLVRILTVLVVDTIAYKPLIVTTIRCCCVIGCTHPACQP